jgi:hypothetical protein
MKAVTSGTVYIFCSPKSANLLSILAVLLLSEVAYCASASISSALNATSYMRTSSIIPDQ